MIDNFHENGTEFLSNFFSSEIEIGGEFFPTVEHAFQASKSNDPMDALVVARASTPGKAKRLGRKLKLRADWDSIKVGVMKDLLLLKFAPGTFLSGELLDTGAERLIEGNKWHDQFWGNCTCDEHKFIPGKNMLGRLLMEIRDTRFNEILDTMPNCFDDEEEVGVEH
jgi:ribA/ribD-fused uncharacterized protein